MTKRENVLSLYRRKGYEWAPIEFSLCPALIDEYKRRTGDMNGNYEDYFDFNIRGSVRLKLRERAKINILAIIKEPLRKGRRLTAMEWRMNLGAKRQRI